ncbi:hypothetical protein PVAP13_7NG098789 [Panicum virgatum]|uniref:Uncharacterized protein n=1 Tax=Panicum virgatum TaxID=38727 RepID=A0A8T0PWI6_PANVG|nr:hypothetical protein PVAP13_7NG098789 [Panicum virgatum]
MMARQRRRGAGALRSIAGESRLRRGRGGETRHEKSSWRVAAGRRRPRQRDGEVRYSEGELQRGSSSRNGGAAAVLGAASFGRRNARVLRGRRQLLGFVEDEGVPRWINTGGTGRRRPGQARQCEAHSSATGGVPGDTGKTGLTRGSRRLAVEDRGRERCTRALGLERAGGGRARKWAAAWEEKRRKLGPRGKRKRRGSGPGWATQERRERKRRGRPAQEEEKKGARKERVLKKKTNKTI